MQYVPIPIAEWQKITAMLNRIDQKLSKVTPTRGNWITEQEAIALTGKSKETLRKMRNGRRIKGELVTAPVIHQVRSLNGRDFQYWKPELESLFLS
ncbi:MAG: hypothetical protein V4717_14420 [Bacteroidota bacterium]